LCSLRELNLNLYLNRCATAFIVCSGLISLLGFQNDHSSVSSLDGIKKSLLRLFCIVPCSLGTLVEKVWFIHFIGYFLLCCYWDELRALSPAHFVVVIFIFQRGSLLFTSDPTLPFYASCRAGTTVVNHCALLLYWDRVMLNFCLGWFLTHIPPDLCLPSSCNPSDALDKHLKSFLRNAISDWLYFNVSSFASHFLLGHRLSFY
jgi:hypothetical protein